MDLAGVFVTVGRAPFEKQTGPERSQQQAPNSVEHN